DLRHPPRRQVFRHRRAQAGDAELSRPAAGGRALPLGRRGDVRDARALEPAGPDQPLVGFFAFGGPAAVKRVPGGSIAQSGGSPQVSSYTRSGTGRRRGGRGRPAGLPIVIVPAMSVPSGIPSSARSSASTGKCQPVKAPPYPSARAASNRFWHAG